MNILEVLLNVDKSDRNSTEPSIEDFCRLAEVSQYDIEYSQWNTRLKAYWVSAHMCTDTIVGIQAIYFDGMLVGYATQPARKSDYVIKFVNDDSANEVIGYIRSIAKPEPRYGLIPPKELEMPFPDFDSLKYANELLRFDCEGFVDGRACTVTCGVGTGYIKSDFEVKFKDNDEIRIVECSDYKFPFRVTKS